MRKYYPLCIHREPQKLVDIFLSATSSKLTDYNAVCNSDLEQNVMCDAINFTHVTQLMFLHHLMKFESAKMQVNTKLVFLLLTTKWPTNVINYVVVVRESAGKSSKLTFISQHVFLNVPATDTYTWSPTVASLVSRSVDIRDTLFSVMPSLRQVFSQVIELCFVYDLQHVIPPSFVFFWVACLRRGIECWCLNLHRKFNNKRFCACAVKCCWKWP